MFIETDFTPVIFGSKLHSHDLDVSLTDFSSFF